MPKVGSAIVLAVLVSVVVIVVIRDNVTAVNTQIAGMLQAPQPHQMAPPDLMPFAVTLAVESAAASGAGPAPIFAVATVMCRFPDGKPLGAGEQIAEGVKLFPGRSP